MKRQQDLQFAGICSACGGTGKAGSGEPGDACHVCHGIGRLLRARATPRLSRWKLFDLAMVFLFLAIVVALALYSC